jgi:hypothetical protein
VIVHVVDHQVFEVDVGAVEKLDPIRGTLCRFAGANRRKADRRGQPP